MSVLVGLIVAGAIADFAGGAFDAHETLRGIDHGVAVEGNAVVRWLAKYLSLEGSLITFNLTVTTGLLVPGAVLAYHDSIASSLFFGGLLFNAVHHLLGAFKWRYLINGGQIDRSKPVTWWQKLLGINFTN